MFVKIILISFVGGLLCLDRVFIQAMISRPIIIAPVIGSILGDPYAGLIIGAILELFWIDRVPIGIYIPPNDSIAAAMAASTAILTSQALGIVTKELMALSILLAIPFGILAKKMDVKIIESNNVLSDQALDDAKALDIRAIERKTYLGLAKVSIFYIVLLFILQLIFIPVMIWIYPKLPVQVNAMLSLTYYFLPLVGIAVALNTIKLRRAIPVFCAIFLVVAMAMEFFHVF
ncbi:MAG: PTS sugar transporter subunit IIC [Desulfobacterales bacterium]|nr:PTS sugar transporter subunit IIC [Desulfobacterales bacterium]